MKLTNLEITRCPLDSLHMAQGCADAVADFFRRESLPRQFGNPSLSRQMRPPCNIDFIAAEFHPPVSNLCADFRHDAIRMRGGESVANHAFERVNRISHIGAVDVLQRFDSKRNG